jgi:hypothetical protein
MVIHDMKNPCNSTEYGINESLQMIRESIADLQQFNNNLEISMAAKLY